MVLPIKHRRLLVPKALKSTTVCGRVEIRDVEGKTLGEFLRVLDYEIRGMEQDMLDLRLKLLKVPPEVNS